MVSEEKARRRLKEHINLKMNSNDAKRVLKGRRIMKRLCSQDPKRGGPTDTSREAAEGCNGDENTVMESSLRQTL